MPRSIRSLTRPRRTNLCYIISSKLILFPHKHPIHPTSFASPEPRKFSSPQLTHLHIPRSGSSSSATPTPVSAYYTACLHSLLGSAFVFVASKSSLWVRHALLPYFSNNFMFSSLQCHAQNVTHLSLWYSSCMCAVSIVFFHALTSFAASPVGSSTVYRFTSNPVKGFCERTRSHSCYTINPFSHSPLAMQCRLQKITPALATPPSNSEGETFSFPTSSNNPFCYFLY